MAIRVRRGNYADLDKSRLVAGEPLTTLDMLPDGDYYVGMTIAPNNVVRLATWTNLETVLEDCREYAESAEESKDAAAISEENAAESETNAETYWGYVHDAVELVEPEVNINFTTGQLEVSGSSWWFGINQTTGNLEWAVSHA